jgi:hypothetical protein
MTAAETDSQPGNMRQTRGNAVRGRRRPVENLQRIEKSSRDAFRRGDAVAK